MLILRTLLFGPAHGHQIAKHIQRMTDDVLQVEHGSLYPALHRLERKGWVASKWEMAKERKRELKYYRLTPAGRKQLAREEKGLRILARELALPASRDDVELCLGLFHRHARSQARLEVAEGRARSRTRGVPGDRARNPEVSDDDHPGFPADRDSRAVC